MLRSYTKLCLILPADSLSIEWVPSGSCLCSMHTILLMKQLQKRESMLWLAYKPSSNDRLLACLEPIICHFIHTVVSHSLGSSFYDLGFTEGVVDASEAV